MNPCIMIVDDEQLTVGLLTDWLLDAVPGATVHGQLDGCAALDAIRQQRPHLLVVGAAMPALDGWELLESVRRLPELDLMEIIVLGADASANEPDRIEALRVSCFMTMLPTRDDFIERVGELLGVRTRTLKQSDRVLVADAPSERKRDGAARMPCARMGWLR